MRFLSCDKQASRGSGRRFKLSDVFSKFQRGDVVGKIDHQSSVRVVRSGQIQRVGDPQRFFFNHVVNPLTGQALPDMFGNLPDELI